MVIKGILPWCLTPELYAAKPDFVVSLADFVRGRPMPPVDAFLRQSGAGWPMTRWTCSGRSRRRR